MNYIENNTEAPLKEILERIQDRIIATTSYFGIPAQKNPLDFWVYQEIIFENKPDVIIEIGNRFGGSTLALAHLLDLIGNGRIIAIDIDHSIIFPLVRDHPRITLLEGDACVLGEDAGRLINSTEKVMVIEDSSHTVENTLTILSKYSKFIKSGGYFIVEDGICHHGLDIGPEPGPYEAIECFIRENSDFEIDRGKESFLITWNPKGYLRRK